MMRVLKLLAINLIALALASAASAGTCSGPWCSFSYGAVWETWADADCSTYVEVTTEVVNSPAVTEETVHITTVEATNCDNTTRNTELSYAYDVAETIEHTASASSNVKFAMEIGKKDVIKIPLEYATVQTGGWKWTDTYRNTISAKFPAPIPPCSRYYIKVFGVKRVGHVDGTAQTTVQVRARRNFHYYWETASQDCDTCRSVADGTKLYSRLNIVSYTGRPTPGSCPNCPTCVGTPPPGQ